MLQTKTLLRAGAGLCPACGSGHVGESVPETVGEGVIEQTSDCGDCLAEWTAVYQIVAVVTRARQRIKKGSP